MSTAEQYGWRSDETWVDGQRQAAWPISIERGGRNPRLEYVRPDEAPRQGNFIREFDK